MEIVFFVEELSMKCVLETILPKIISKDVTYRVFSHDGKGDLKASFPIKLRAWLKPETKFVIMQDQDKNDCKKLKQEIVQLCGNKSCLVRIVCHELEAWYIGDLKAVAQAYNLPNLCKYENKSKFRDPDALESPKKELKKLVPQLTQVLGAQKISLYMDIERNRSKSFQVFVEGVRKICQ